MLGAGRVQEGGRVGGWICGRRASSMHAYLYDAIIWSSSYGHHSESVDI